MRKMLRRPVSLSGSSSASTGCGRGVPVDPEAGTGAVGLSAAPAEALLRGALRPSHSGTLACVAVGAVAWLGLGAAGATVRPGLTVRVAPVTPDAPLALPEEPPRRS